MSASQAATFRRLNRPLGRLFWKIFAAAWLALLLTGSLVGTLLWLDSRSIAERYRVLDDGPLGQMMVDAAASIAAHGGRPALIEWMQRAPREGGRPRPSVYAIDAQGRELLGRPVPEVIIDAARASMDGPASSDQRRPALRRLDVDGETLLVFVALPPLRPTHQPGAELHPLPGVRLPPWAMPLATGLVSSLILAALLAWYFARPLRALDSAFKSAGQGDLSVRVAPVIGSRRDEVADLGRGFDQMVERLDALLQAQRRLLHDVSHELRSPLARLQVCVGLARRDPAQASAMLERIERETGQMDALIEEILTLARLEAGTTSEEPAVRNDLAALVDEICEDNRIEAGARNVAVVLQGVGTTPVDLLARPVLLRRAIENVVRNAIQFAPAGTTVEVVMHDSAANVTIEVSDRGPGLSAAACEDIFKPFVRGGARSGKGFGLGLAIALRAVQAHDGTIAAHPRNGGGLVVTIVLPKQAA